MLIAEQPVKAVNEDAWAVSLDENGNLAEGVGANIFIVRDGVLMTPQERFVLPGCSRQMVLDLATKLKMHWIEKDIDLFEAANAEEMFLTSTSLCILPIRLFNGKPIGGTGFLTKKGCEKNASPSTFKPGPITQLLINAYSQEGKRFLGHF